MSASATSAPPPFVSRHGLNLESELWRFAVSFYGREGVAVACQTLQERAKVDINLLLFILFAFVHHGRTLPCDDLTALDGLVGGWRGEVGQPLRRIRTRLKTGPSPAPTSETGALREAIKCLEIRAEQIELAVLSDWLNRRPARGEASGSDALAIIGDVVCYFSPENRTALSEPASMQAIEVLRRAAIEASAKATPSPSFDR